MTGATGLEVVAKGPVAEHLEEGVVVRVAADVLEICAGQRRPRHTYTAHSPLCFPPARMHFCELNARLSLAMSDLGSTVPRNIALNYPSFSTPLSDLESSRTYLVHPRVRKEQGGVVERDRGR